MRQHRRFETTHWSLVLAAGQTGSPEATDALASLCERYWYPLYAFARRHGHDADAAQDLTQAFFARVIEKRYLRDATPERGRFRSFLLASFKHFLANEWDRATALKRGGGQVLLPLEIEEAEGRYSREPPDHETPERVYDRQWALTLLDRVIDRLHAEMAEGGKAPLFAALKSSLVGEQTVDTHAEIGARLGMSAGAVKVAAHRLRRRYRDLLREEIAETVRDPTEVDAEISHLLAAVA